jgi:hypothetical protein
VYRHTNGLHRDYSALPIAEFGYRVRDDANKNGHWDSDRNGWLPPDTDPDHDRAGSGHNIHMASENAPLGQALVGAWSAGCQTIVGRANWEEFITHAWTGFGDEVDYFLVDTRDIDKRVWGPCAEDGSHACPFEIQALPFSRQFDTSAGDSGFDSYNCFSGDQPGPEVVFLLVINQPVRIAARTECQMPARATVYLLDADDSLACLLREETQIAYDLVPGRYFIIVEPLVENDQVLSGSCELSVDYDH